MVEKPQSQKKYQTKNQKLKKNGGETLSDRTLLSSTTYTHESYLPKFKHTHRTARTKTATASRVTLPSYGSADGCGKEYVAGDFYSGGGGAAREPGSLPPTGPSFLLSTVIAEVDAMYIHFLFFIFFFNEA